MLIQYSIFVIQHSFRSTLAVGSMPFSLFIFHCSFSYLCNQAKVFDMTRKKLPIGIQTFRDIRDPKQNYVYVDKTDIAYEMIDNGSYYFLSRPGRFGKTLFLDTLSEIFKGHKEYFEGLYIYDKWNWEEKFPVVKISLASGGFSTGDNIKEVIKAVISRNCIQLGLNFEEINHSQAGISLSRLIEAAYERYNQKVVVLIDEYDKPILDNIGLEDKTMAYLARDILNDFYSVIKGSDQYLRFVLLTGVSTFSTQNLFSGLNNLQDITVHYKYANITGFTHADLKRYFSDYTEGVDLEKVKKWYNGYNYFGEPFYNPYDILFFFSKSCEFCNYWWGMGYPSFLIEILKQGQHYLPDLENIEVSREVLNAFDVDQIDIVALLWQTGYLTFDKKIQLLDEVNYKMKIPNLEIQKSLNALFFNYLTNLDRGYSTKKRQIVGYLHHKDFDTFLKELKSLFASIPYDNYVNNNVSVYEGYYASVIFAFLSSLGFEVKTEDHTNHGRIDMTMIGPESIFILEFKVDMPDEAAIHQIESKKYYEKYLTEKKAIFLIGIHFDSDERNIVNFEWKELIEI